MSLPPKTDDEISAPDEGSKPVKRGRPRSRKADGDAEAPKEEGQPAIFAPDRRPEPEGQGQQAQAHHDSSPSDGGGNRDVASEQGGGNDGRQGEPQGQGGGQGGRGEWQDRNSWKRNKRKRAAATAAGQWQQGRGGGGGRRRPRYPPQPAAPEPRAGLRRPAESRRASPTWRRWTRSPRKSRSGKGEPLYLDELYALQPGRPDRVRARLRSVDLRGGAQPQAAARRRSSPRPPRTSAPICDRGYVDLTDRGAFIVHEHVNYRLYPEDAYLPESLIRRYGLKRGHQVEVLVQAAAGRRALPVGRAHRQGDGPRPRGDLQGHARSRS